MYHFEGGWPKDINMKDVEQTVRYRRKIEKDELYIHTMLQLLPVIITFVGLLKNNLYFFKNSIIDFKFFN